MTDKDQIRQALNDITRAWETLRAIEGNLVAEQVMGELDKQIYRLNAELRRK